LTIADWS